MVPEHPDTPHDEPSEEEQADDALTAPAPSVGVPVALLFRALLVVIITIPAAAARTQSAEAVGDQLEEGEAPKHNQPDRNEPLPRAIVLVQGTCGVGWGRWVWSR